MTKKTPEKALNTRQKPAKDLVSPFSDAELERYSRQIILREIGGVGQNNLKNARILIVGAGGLGSPLAAYLTGAGIGHITLVDDDHIDLSNLQRQIFYLNSDQGAPKAVKLAERLRALNPHVDIKPIEARLDQALTAQLLAQGAYDLIADTCDNFATRLMVSDEAVRAKITLISGAVAGYVGQIATFKPHQGADLPCYRCFVGAHPGEMAERTCADAGILGPVTGFIASLQAFEIIRELTPMGRNNPQYGLAGRLRLIDMLDGSDRLIALPADPLCPACSRIAAPCKSKEV